MPENRMSGPQVGQMVHWTTSQGAAPLPAIIYAVSNGVASVTIINGTTITSQASARWDETRSISNSWSYPDMAGGL